MTSDLPYFYFTMPNIEGEKRGSESYKAVGIAETGTTVTLISSNHAILSDKHCVVYPSDIVLKSFNEKVTKVLGRIEIECLKKKSNGQLKVYISPFLPGADVIFGFNILRKSGSQFRLTIKDILEP